MIELNKIYNENCLETMARMPSNFIDLTVTSPPYDNLRTYNGYVFDFKTIAEFLYQVTKPSGVVVWVVGDATINGNESGSSFEQALYFKKIGFNLHDTMIYEKTNFSFPSKNRYHQIFEYMFVFSKGKPKTFNPIKDVPVKYGLPWGKNSHRNKEGVLVATKKRETFEPLGMRTNIWRINCAKGFNTKDEIAHKHPAIFPEKLAEGHILSWSNEGDLIYDPFMGSGTTAKMAKLHKRNFIGSEVSKEYCEIAEKRLA